MLNLKMQTSKCAAAGVRPVVLNERPGNSGFGVPLLRECFEEEAASVTENSRLNEKDAGEPGFRYVHLLTTLLLPGGGR